MKKRLLVIWVMVIFIKILFCIDFIPCDKIDKINSDFFNANQLNSFLKAPSASDDRNAIFSYHNSTVDQLFYGTDTWAVFFDFSKWYIGVDTLTCRVESVYLYSWQNRNSAKIYLYDNVNNQPGSIIQEKTVSLTQGWNEITINPVTLSKFWVVLNDLTSNNTDSQNYVCASAGSGKNSYYKSGSGFYNFFNHGFKSELLISIKGQLQTNMTDLALTEFDFDGDLSPGQSVRPVIQIANYSKNIAHNAYLIFEYNNPNEELNGRDSVFINTEIAPYEIINIDPQLFDPVVLLSTPNQYLFSANIYCDNMDIEMTGNNLFSQVYNVFSDTLDFVTIENFIQSGNYTSNSLWTSQNDIMNTNILRLDYFPDYSDLCHQLVFTDKNALYQNYAYPNTIIQGSNKITGYNSSTYTSQINAYINEMLGKKTFIRLEQVDIDTLSGSMTINFKLKNQETRLFSNYLSDCMVQAFIVQPYQFNEKNCISVSNYLSNMKTGITLTANYASEQSVDFSLAFDKIILYGDNQINDASLVIQVVKKSSNEILFNHITPVPNLDISTISAHVTVDEPVISIWPNPSNMRSDLSIKSDQINKIDIFNIKGQKINTLHHGLNSLFHWDYTDKNNQKVSSGIYFLRVSQHNGKQKVKKIMLLK